MPYRTAIVFDVVEEKKASGEVSYAFKQVDLEAELPPALASARTFDVKKGDLRVKGWFETDNRDFAIQIYYRFLGTWKQVGSYTGNVETAASFSIHIPIFGPCTLRVQLAEGILSLVFSFANQEIQIPLLTL
ncbi:hypothetical protein RBB50_005721 [Rhinocladiella similis]